LLRDSARHSVAEKPFPNLAPVRRKARPIEPPLSQTIIDDPDDRV
jgi:hypothetical protein